MIDHTALTHNKTTGYCNYTRPNINWHYQRMPDLVKSYLYAKKTGGLSKLSLSEWVHYASKGTAVRWTTIRNSTIFNLKSIADYRPLPIQRVLEQRHKKDFEMPILVQYHSKRYTVVYNGIYLTVATEVFKRNPLVWIVSHLDEQYGKNNKNK